MLPTPKRFSVVAGSGQGETRLTAFDRALLDAGIGNLNLIRVSSVLPPGCEYAPQIDLPPGSLVPTAYGALISDEPGEEIAAAIGVGLSPDSFGMIFEYAAKGTREQAEEAVAAMLREAFASRGMQLQRSLIKGVERRVERVACVIAAAALWY